MNLVPSKLITIFSFDNKRVDVCIVSVVSPSESLTRTGAEPSSETAQKLGRPIGDDPIQIHLQTQRRKKLKIPRSNA